MRSAVLNSASNTYGLYNELVPSYNDNLLLETLKFDQCVMDKITSFNEQTTLNLMTLGTIPVFLFGSVLFIQHVKSSVYHQKGTNKAFILSAIVFAYGSYMLLLT